MGRVEPHLPVQRWEVREIPSSNDRIDGDLVTALAEAMGLSPLVAKVLVNRGITTPEAATQFLNPESLELPSPLAEFPDLALSLDLLDGAIDRQEPIAICGDYDADGMTSTALLLRSLRSLGAIVDYAIPSRMSEGYGINDRIVREFHQDGVKLILTVDNGIAAHQPIALARELGLDVIVTDHHDLPPELPIATAILNPKLLSNTSPYRGLAGVGVAYVLAISLSQYLAQYRQRSSSPNFVNTALELFTLGTIADLAPLVGVNRRWVKRGLGRLPHSEIPGIRALIRVAGLEPNTPPSRNRGKVREFTASAEFRSPPPSTTTTSTSTTHAKTSGKSTKTFKPDDIGFQLGPRINAIGRIGDPQVVIELLTTNNLERAYILAQECEDANQYRRQLCQEIEQEAIEICEVKRDRIAKDKVLLVLQSGWHHGVIGIVASRLVERYGVPVFIATPEDDTHIRGSARSIPEFHIFEALEHCKDLLDRHGGHRAAGGFSLHRDRWDDFQQRLAEFANRSLHPQHLKPLVKLDGEAPLADLTWDLYHQIDSLHPWGIENPEPIFWSRQLRVVEQSPIGVEQQHLKLVLSPLGDSRSFKALFWQGGRFFPLASPVDVAFRLRQNTWQGSTNLELEVVGVRSSEITEISKMSEISEISKISEISEMSKISEMSNSAEPHSTQLPLEIPLEIPLGIPLTKLPGTDLSKTNSSKPNSSGTKTTELPEQKEKQANAHFTHNDRLYHCAWAWTNQTWELRIRNDRDQVLAVPFGATEGLLGNDRASAKTVDIREPKWATLVALAQQTLLQR